MPQNLPSGRGIGPPTFGCGCAASGSSLPGGEFQSFPKPKAMVEAATIDGRNRLDNLLAETESSPTALLKAI
ncbi:MAG TPA: hypothetical protein P5525_24010 [Candidatus Paceibacterota bacterium]|nr:hypothetical protein [Candidatus Paceibacterota bacterium]